MNRKGYLRLVRIRMTTLVKCVARKFMRNENCVKIANLEFVRNVDEEVVLKVKKCKMTKVKWVHWKEEEVF